MSSVIRRGFQLVVCQPLECRLTVSACARRYTDAQIPHSRLWESPCRECPDGRQRAGHDADHRPARVTQIGQFVDRHGRVGVFVCACGTQYNRRIAHIYKRGNLGCRDCYRKSTKSQESLRALYTNAGPDPVE